MLKKVKEKGNSFNYILFIKADLTNNVFCLQYFHACLYMKETFNIPIESNEFDQVNINH